MALQLGLNRILKEIKQVNSQFQNLRTYIVPDPKNERADLFYFVLFPADGSLADRPVVGKMFLPKICTYPDHPPVIHVFTETLRYNVDVFNRGDDSWSERSSMCFDILEKKSSSRYSTGIWEKEFTLSAVFASLLQVLVEYKVQQVGYGDYTPEAKTEAVSMQKMASQHVMIDQVWAKYKHYFPKCPKIERTRAKRIPVKQRIQFPSDQIMVSFDKSSRIYASYPFLLASADFSVVVDLTDFRRKLHLDKHLYNFVVSIVLSNSPRDPFGRRDDTVLVRDGITATAAKKLANDEMRWFYHGAPLTDFQKICVTVSHKQITFVVEKEASENLIFGDTVLSYLTEAELGPSVHNQLFYLLVYVETKQNIEFLTEKEAKEAHKNPICIHLNTDTTYGYIHPSDRYNTGGNGSSHQLLNVSVELGKMILTDAKQHSYLTNLINFQETVKEKSQEAVVEFSKRNMTPEALKSWQNTHIELDSRLIGFLRLFLSEWESQNRKVVKKSATSIQQSNTVMPSQPQPPPQPTVRLTVVNRRTTVASTVNTEPSISPASFWSALRIDDSKPLPKPIGTPNTPSSSSTSSSPAKSSSSSFVDFVDLSNSSSGVGSSVEESLLDSVTKVTIYLTKNANLMYQDILESQNMSYLLAKYEKVISQGHIVLCHRNDFFPDEWEHFVTSNYTEDQLVEFHVRGVVYDEVAFVLLMDAKSTKPKFDFKQTKYRRNLVTTIAINGTSPLSYGNNLVDRALDNYRRGREGADRNNKNHVTVKYFNQPIRCLGQIKFHRK